MQNEMLKVDSAESSAQEGHTYAILQGVGQGAVLRLAQGSQLLPKKTRSTTPPFSHGAKTVYGCMTKLLRSKISEILAIFGLQCSCCSSEGNNELFCLLRSERSET